MWLFDGNENVSAIHVNDDMMIGCSYQFLMDVCKANATYEKGKKLNPNFTMEDALKITLKEHIAMVVENTWEEFELCKEAMVKEMERRYAE